MNNLKQKTKKFPVFKLRTINYKLKASRGFTLLFASLIGALVLAVGLAILSIALKQLQLSSAGRESQKAFYSADAGVECALFLDRGGVDTDCRLGFFGTPSTTSATVDICGGSQVDPNFMECFGRKVDISEKSRSLIAGAPYVISSFVLNDQNDTIGTAGGTNNDMCFNVDVKKVIDDLTTTNIDETATIIESRGYNSCNSSLVNRYERAIRVENF